MTLFTNHSTAHAGLARQLSTELVDERWKVTIRGEPADNDVIVRELIRFFIENAFLAGQACAEAQHGLDVVTGAIRGGLSPDAAIAVIQLDERKLRRRRGIRHSKWRLGYTTGR